MSFDARRWPNAVTIGCLIAERMNRRSLQQCARHVVIDPATLSRSTSVGYGEVCAKKFDLPW